MQQDCGGLGYPKQSAFARLGGSRDTSGESYVPVNSIEASETNEAVDSLKMTQSHLYLVLTLTYAQCLPRHLVAKRMCRAESTVKRNLEDADHAVARWLDDRKLARENIRANAN